MRRFGRGRRSGRTDPAVVHGLSASKQEKTVEEGERLKVGLMNRANDENALLACETLQESDNLAARSAVETAGRLVKDEDARLGHDRAGDGDATLLAARDAALERRADPVPGDGRQSERGEGGVDVLVDVGVRRAESVEPRENVSKGTIIRDSRPECEVGLSGQQGLHDSRKVGSKGDCLANRQHAEQSVVLLNKRKEVAGRVVGRAVDGDETLGARRALADGVQKSRLAGARRAHN